MRPEVEKKITENSNPFQISLAGMGINDDEIVEILEKIKKVTPTVITIDFDNNNITDEGAKILTKQIYGFAKMKEISLQFNTIGREGALELFSLKKHFSKLDILFHGNKISDVLEMDDIENQGLTHKPKL